ncbi:MAG: lipid II flippase MurJ [Patescibacteria group bacterium]|nr:lipid II flippase MurJ [bacterium]MDZ4240667.1 lipid II flippase MurJ [Patescibacteria group bacterium]
MVKKIFYFLQKEVGGLHQAAYLLAVFAFLSLLLALVRDRLLAHFFGAGQALDIYYAAFRIPDFIFVTVGSLVSLSILVPLLVERGGRDVREEKSLIDNLFTFFFLLIFLVSAIAFFLVPVLVPILFPGFDLSLIPQLVFLTRLLLLSPILLGFSNLFGSIAQAHRRFFVYAIAPTLYNLGIILGTLIFSSLYGIAGVGFGVILGSFLHMAIQIPVIARYGLLPVFSFNFSSVKHILLLSLPRTFTLSISHLSTLLLLALASLQTTGSISVFSLSFNLQSVPLSVIGVSYSLAAFPTLARFFSEGKQKEFLDEVLTSARHIIFWSVPVAVLFIVLRAQIVRVIFGSGEFDWSDTRLTAAALALFAISCFFQSLTLLFVRGYYSAGQTLKPLLLNLFGGVSTVFFAYFLTKLFSTLPVFRFFVESLLRVEGIPGTEVLMLPLAYSFGALLTGLLLWVFFELDFGKFSKDLVVTLFHSFSASVIMGFYTYLLLNFLSRFLNLDTFVGIFFQGLLAGITGIVIGIFVLQLLQNRELKEVTVALREKIWKVRAVSPDTDLVQGL